MKLQTDMIKGLADKAAQGAQSGDLGAREFRARVGGLMAGMVDLGPEGVDSGPQGVNSGT
jgi:hypothetical protein